MFHHCYSEAMSDEEYEVEKLIRHRDVPKGRQFLLRWKGWGPEYDEWVDEDKLVRKIRSSTFFRHVMIFSKNIGE